MSNVLIIEDEPLIREMLDSMLSSSFSLRADHAENGLEGTSLSRKRPYDFICLDYKMPQMNGIAFIKELRTTTNPNQYTPIILISGHQPDLAKVENELGDVFFLDKPINNDRFDFFVKTIMVKKSSKKSH